MAAITITRQIDQNTPLVSAFQQHSIEFTFDTTGMTNTTGSYAEVVVNGYTFRAVKTGYNGANDYYFFDFGNILAQILGFPKREPAMTDLLTTPTIVVNGRYANGTLAATATHPKIEVCFAVSALGRWEGLNMNYLYGFYNVNTGSLTQYHYGYVCFYWHGAAGTYNLKIDNNPTESVTLTHGFNRIDMNYGLNFDGMLSVGTTALFMVKRVVSSASAFWHYVGESGCLLDAGFTIISTEKISKRDKEIEFYAETNELKYSRTAQIGQTVTERVKVKTIAIDLEHFKQLQEIGTTGLIWRSSQNYRVVDYPKEVLECRQNLVFTATLERDLNAVGY